MADDVFPSIIMPAGAEDAWRYMESPPIPPGVFPPGYSGSSNSGDAATNGGAPEAVASPSGMLEPGNIDLNARPIVKNPDGSISTVRSMGVNIGGREVLIPTVAADGSRILSDEEAIQQYRQTGQHLGKFDTPENSTAYAEKLHNDQAQQYAPPAAPQQYTVPGSAPRDLGPVPDTGQGTWWNNAVGAAGDIGTAAAGLAERFNKGALNTLGLRSPGSDIYRAQIPVAEGLGRAGDVATFLTGGLSNSLFPAPGALSAAAGYAPTAARSLGRTAAELAADEAGSVPLRGRLARGTPIEMPLSTEEAAAARAAEVPAEAAPAAKEAEPAPTPVPEGVRAPGVAAEAPAPTGTRPPEGVSAAAAEAPTPPGVMPPEEPPPIGHNAKMFADELRTAHKAQENPLPFEGAKEAIVPPPHIQNEADLDGLVDRYVQYAINGAVGKPWYNKSGQAIITHAGDEPRLADAVIGGVARTSPQTDVASNLGHAVTLHSQAMVGDPLKGGRFPNTMGKDVEGYYYRGEPISGAKIGPFASASAREWNPDPSLHTLVNDIWNMRALEYPGKDGKLFGLGENEGSVTSGQHNFARIVADRARTKLEAITGESWTPEQVQASAWTGVKAHHEGIPVTQAAGDFADAMASHYAQIPWESAPGVTSGHLPEYHNATWDQKEAFHRDIHAALTDDKGRDLVSLGLGLLTGPSTRGSGFFRGAAAPGSQAQVVAGQAKGGALKGIDPASRQLIETSAIVRALLLRQDATAAYKPLYAANTPIAKRDLFDVDFGRPIKPQEAEAIHKAMTAETGSDFFSPIGHGTGFALRNVPEVSGVSNKDFALAAQKVVDKSALPDLKTFQSASDGFFLENKWNRNKNGETYTRRLGATGSPDVQKRAADLLAALGPRVDAVVRHHADINGWTPSATDAVWERPGFKAQGYGQGVIRPPQPGVDIRPRAEQTGPQIFPKKGAVLSLGGLGLGLGLTGQSGLLPGETGR